MDTPVEPLEPSHRDRITPFSLFLLILVALTAALYTALFTPLGNSNLSPWIEKKLSNVLKHPVQLTTFVLTLDTFELALSDKDTNTFNASGDYNLFPPSINSHYHLHLPTSANPLKTPVEITGTLQGTYHRLILQGHGEIFKGGIDYNSTLSFLKPNAVDLIVHHIDYQSLMDYLEYPHNSHTLIDGTISITGLYRRNITANATATARTTYFKPTPIMEDDNESFDFWALLADKNGKITPFKINAEMTASMNELGILEQFVSYPLRSGASAHAAITGSQHELLIETNAKIARGDINASLNLHKLRPHHLILEARKINTPALFTLLSLPSPLKGTLSGVADTNFTDASIKLNVAKAQTNPDVLKKHYHITQPLIHFNSTMSMKITPNSTITSGTFKSDLEDLRFDGSPTHEQMLQEFLKQIKSTRTKANL